jgi:hypothetical protein
MDLASLLALLPKLLSYLLTPFLWTAKKIRLLTFRVWNIRPPLSGEEAKKAAFSVLFGDILKALSYKNINSKHIFIAAVQRKLMDLTVEFLY